MSSFTSRQDLAAAQFSESPCLSPSQQESMSAVSFPLDSHAKEARIESVAEFISFFIFNSLGIEDMTLEQV